MRREWIEMLSSFNLSKMPKSPSMRREWIEMAKETLIEKALPVSLHAEGVD